MGGAKEVNATIKKVKKDELQMCLNVIHRSFKTVADEFGLTRDNCPRHTGFLPLYFLESQMEWGWMMYSLFSDEKLIGYMSLSSEDGKIFELHNLSVLPEHRHGGYGKMLLDYAKSEVLKSGGEIIKIGIIDESTILKDWYIKNGFEHIGTKKFEHLPFTSGYLEWKGKEK